MTTSRTTRTDLNQTLYVKPTILQKERQWHVIDAADRVLGDVATLVASRLIGKHKVHQWDAWDAGDFVVVKNAPKVAVTGRKKRHKMYYKHTGYKGHLRETLLDDMLRDDPAEVIRLAVYGMLPKNKLRKQRMKRLKILVDDDTSRYDNFTLNELS